MKGRSLLTAGFCVLGLMLAGCKSDPATPEHWEKRLADAKGKKEKLKVVEALRGSKYLTDKLYPMLTKHLGTEKSGEVRAALARLLGEKKVTAALDALTEAVEAAPGDADGRALNMEIATALGELGDKKAVPTLLRLLRTKDDYTVIAAVDSLGKLKATEAFEPLNDLANDDAIAPFITRKAIEALGELGDPRAVPALVKGMYKERKGVSFYRESSFALYQLGQPSADALVPVAQEKDKELAAWAKGAGMPDFVLLVKAMQVLGDLHDARAVPAVVKALGYKSEYGDVQLIMRTRAADAAGRLRAKDAVKPLLGLLDDPSQGPRHEYAWALVRIGSKDAAGRLLETASKGPWEARDESARGYAMLGDDPSALEKLAEREPKAFEAECKEDADAPTCRDVAAGAKAHADKLREYAKRAAAGKDCGKDLGCWVKKLDDPSEGVRERAGYELGRSGQASVVGELMKRLPEKGLDARLAFIQGADWLISDGKDAKAEAKKSLEALKKQLADEKGKTEFDKVNEDLRRLAVALER